MPCIMPKVIHAQWLMMPRIRCSTMRSWWSLRGWLFLHRPVRLGPNRWLQPIPLVFSSLLCVCACVLSSRDSIPVPSAWCSRNWYRNPVHIWRSLANKTFILFLSLSFPFRSFLSPTLSFLLYPFLPTMRNRIVRCMYVMIHQSKADKQILFRELRFSSGARKTVLGAGCV